MSKTKKKATKKAKTKQISKTKFDLNDEVIFLRKKKTYGYTGNIPEYTMGKVTEKFLQHIRGKQHVICRVLWENGQDRSHFESNLTCPSDAVIKDEKIIEMMNIKLLADLKTIKVRSLDYSLEFGDFSVKIGCQRVTRDDALLLAERIHLAYK